MDNNKWIIIGICYSNCNFGNRGETTYSQETVPMIQSNIEVLRVVTPRSLRFQVFRDKNISKKGDVTQ